MLDKKPVAAHEQVHTIVEVIEYPEHVQRSESPEFRHNKEELVKHKQTPCFVCDLLDLPSVAGEHLEVHHFVVEWAEWNDADPKKVQNLFDKGVIDFYGYSQGLKGHPVKSPDDIRNLLVLCPTHHRGKGTGIHATTAPTFFSQAVAKDGIEVLKGSLKNGKHN